MQTPHIVVVGGGSEIAQGVIQRYLDRGCKVSAVCYTTTPVHSHCQLTIHKADMASHEARILKDLEPIDVMITLTGGVSNAKIEHMNRSQWDYVLDVNVTTVFHAMKYGLPNILDNGVAIVVGSIVGSTGGYGCANYATAKAALKGLVMAAANENLHRGVRVNLLELGYINAGMGKKLNDTVRDKILPTIPMKRFGTLEEAVQAIEALEKLTYMTGGVLTLAGGLR